MTTSKPIKRRPISNAHPDLALLAGGVAIVTGGASGIGLQLAETAVAHGMHVAIADIDEAALKKQTTGLSVQAGKKGLRVIGVKTDVASAQSVAGLHSAIAEAFAEVPVSLLCCNAGINAGLGDAGSILKGSDRDWDRAFNINVLGIRNCVRAFVSDMIRQPEAGAVVVTASQDGLCASQGVYGTSKHAAVALTEGVFDELQGELSVHVLCPNVVATNIVAGGKTLNNPEIKWLDERFKAFGMSPQRCADAVFDAIQSGRFYVLAEAEDDPTAVRDQAEARMHAILNGGVPFRPLGKLIAKVIDPSVPTPGKNP